MIEHTRDGNSFRITIEQRYFKQTIDSILDSATQFTATGTDQGNVFLKRVILHGLKQEIENRLKDDTSGTTKKEKVIKDRKSDIVIPGRLTN
jgi:hypothetical protein